MSEREREVGQVWHGGGFGNGGCRKGHRERERARRERETAEEEEEGGSGKVGGICSEFEMVEVKVLKDTCVVFVITVFATVKFCAPRFGEPRVFEFS